MSLPQAHAFTDFAPTPHTPPRHTDDTLPRTNYTIFLPLLGKTIPREELIAKTSQTENNLTEAKVVTVSL